MRFPWLRPPSPAERTADQAARAAGTMPTRRIRIPRERPTVGHTLWNIRTPYPTAIMCRCGRVLYRFGTELRHRDGTQCPERTADAQP